MNKTYIVRVMQSGKISYEITSFGATTVRGSLNKAMMMTKKLVKSFAHVQVVDNSGELVWDSTTTKIS